jgi:hypothetical protein
VVIERVSIEQVAVGSIISGVSYKKEGLSMRNKALSIALALGLGLTMIALWLLGVQVSSAVAAPEAERAQVSNAPDTEIHVCPSGCPYSSIQAAVDVASGGDVIKVAAGT